MGYENLKRLHITKERLTKEDMLELMGSVEKMEISQMKFYMALYKEVVDLGEERLQDFDVIEFISDLEESAMVEVGDLESKFKGRQVVEVERVSGAKWNTFLKDIRREYHRIENEDTVKVLTGRAYYMMCVFESYLIERDEMWYPHYINSVYYSQLRGYVFNQKEERIWQPK